MAKVSVLKQFENKIRSIAQIKSMERLFHTEKES